MKKIIILLMFLLTVGCSNLNDNDLKVFLEKENFSPTLTEKYDDGYLLIREDDKDITMYFLSDESWGKYTYLYNSYAITERGVYLGLLKEGSITMHVSNKEFEREAVVYRLEFDDGSEAEFKFEKGKKTYRIFDDRIKEMSFNLYFYNKSGKQIFRLL
ncbi:hypothetical protein [Paenibacillus agilis]|uniref:Lipoprotein n=1 Tax=Paenibacillus agilis TaxID=3020863 RepID=A0A559IKH7_9BACL|nr:hypothetical protein [Paenibacillus agilis]TVX88164.1 hypothetical protein FPZ44_19860 [Paenibacillus agilis]